MELVNQFLIPGGLFLLTLVFGFWLSHAGKPYNGLLFNIHKLIALGCVVLTGIQFSKTFRAPDWQLAVLLAVSALCGMSLFASGALMRAGKLDHVLAVTIHRVALILAVLALAAALFLLRGMKP
jgi:hypothetical protein